MKVTILVSRAGLDFSQAPGDIVDLPEAEAERLIAAGQAAPHMDAGPKTRSKRRKATAEPKAEKREEASDAVDTQDASD